MTVDTRPIAKGRNPLEPIASIVELLLFATGALTLLGTAFTVFGSGSILGFGQAIPTLAAPVIEQRDDLPIYHWHLLADVSGQPSSYRLDVTHPDFAQRFWYTLTGLPTFVLAVGALLLAYRMIRRAQREGIYRVATARRLRTLGWFLIAGSLAAMLIEEVASNRLLATMVANHVGWVTMWFWHIPWALLVFGGTLLTIARIMRISARMNEELEATV